MLGLRFGIYVFLFVKYFQSVGAELTIKTAPGIRFNVKILGFSKYSDKYRKLRVKYSLKEAKFQRESEA